MPILVRRRDLDTVRGPKPPTVFCGEHRIDASCRRKIACAEELITVRNVWSYGVSVSPFRYSCSDCFVLGWWGVSQTKELMLRRLRKTATDLR